MILIGDQFLKEGMSKSIRCFFLIDEIELVSVDSKSGDLSIDALKEFPQRSFLYIFKILGRMGRIYQRKKQFAYMGLNIDDSLLCLHYRFYQEPIRTFLS